MINNIPPRDALRGEPQDATESGPGCNLNSAGHNEDTAGGDLASEEFPISSTSRLQQLGYAFSMYADGSEPGPSSGREHVITESTRSTHYDSFGPSYDQGQSTHDPRDLPEVLTLEELPHASIRIPFIPPREAFYVRDSNPDLYPPQGGPSDAQQLDWGSRTPLPPSQGDTLAFNAPTPTELTLHDHKGFSPVYSDNGRVRHYDRETPTPPPMPVPHPFRGAGEDPNAESVLPYDTRRQRDDASIKATYPFEPVQHSPVGTQNEDPSRTSSFPHQYGGVSHGNEAAGPPFRTQFLPSRHPELGHQYGSHNTSLASVAGPSRSRVTASGEPPGAVSYPGKGKRKRGFEDVGNTTRSRPRARKNAQPDDFAPTQPAPEPPTHHRTKIEQPHYKCGNSQRGWVRQDTVEFFVGGQPGIRLTDALDPHFSGPDQRDDKMFQYPGAGSSVSCRIHFPQYSSRLYQITTTDHKKDRNPRTRKRLAFEVAKRVKCYVEEFKVGMRWEDMVLIKLVHVSRASWIPEIWYEQQPADHS
ncbi:hypothetical protein BJ322DRAFT_825442 [Thelephora terrestris]|uniref:Uncharacterized protein n=1 Tax=Thelephora terrestris TaxID=56493 RepID=A0A9P6L6Z6_9AGAM|nr:hypothetical protein BJ322DRAFT_825442 [Thelephora terrestris]